MSLREMLVFSFLRRTENVSSSQGETNLTVIPLSSFLVYGRVHTDGEIESNGEVKDALEFSGNFFGYPLLTDISPLEYGHPNNQFSFMTNSWSFV